MVKQELRNIVKNGKDVRVFKYEGVCGSRVLLKEISFDDVEPIKEIHPINDVLGTNWAWAHEKEQYADDFKKSVAAWEMYMHFHMNHPGDTAPYFVVIVDDKEYVIR